MRSFTVKENYISSVVSEIIWLIQADTHTHTHTDILLLLYKDQPT